MNADLTDLERARTLLKQDVATTDILAVLGQIGPSNPAFPAAQHLRAKCAIRNADYTTAKTLLVDAIRRGEAALDVWLDLARVGPELGMPEDVARLLGAALPRVTPQTLGPFGVNVLRAMKFFTPLAEDWKHRAFDNFTLPLIDRLLENDQIELSIIIEGLCYSGYVKPFETEKHFSRSMGRMALLFTKAGHRLREARHEQCKLPSSQKYKIGFFIHSASTLAHVEVLISFLKGYRTLDIQPFEPIVYCFSSNDADMERIFSDLGVRLMMIGKFFPEKTASNWERLLKLREMIRDQGVHELVWVSVTTMLPLAFAMRIAPVQTWWAMKYRSLSLPDIDGYLTGSALTKFGTINGRRWRMSQLGVDDWYDSTQEAESRKIRKMFSGSVILMTLARTEKMRDPAYLQSIVTVLIENPNAVFLWAGQIEDSAVSTAFANGGVLERTHFLGWVNTKLYTQVADVFLDSFPFPCGFTLFQAMAAGKPVVIYESLESTQVGLWSFLKPIVDDGEGSAAQRMELLEILGQPPYPNISIARTAADYIRTANLLVEDASLRERAGEASRRFIQRYFSDPRQMGASVSEHLIELIERALEPHKVEQHS